MLGFKKGEKLNEIVCCRHKINAKRNVFTSYSVYKWNIYGHQRWVLNWPPEFQIRRSPRPKIFPPLTHRNLIVSLNWFRFLMIANKISPNDKRKIQSISQDSDEPMAFSHMCDKKLLKNLIDWLVSQWTNMKRGHKIKEPIIICLIIFFYHSIIITVCLGIFSPLKNGFHEFGCWLTNWAPFSMVHHSISAHMPTPKAKSHYIHVVQMQNPTMRIIFSEH